jgi:hypothetical protein
MKRIKILITALLALLMTSCVEKPDNTVEYLDVNPNNISGKWELVQWNGSSLAEGTYVYLDIVRNDNTYTMYQNVNSFSNIPHIVTGSYYINYDPELGAVIRGDYDHDSGDWNHRYIIKDLTATEMLWIAKDDPAFTQKYVRVDSIPVK